MTAKDALLALLVTVIWGFNIIMVKVGTAELPPFLLTGLRFLAVAVLVLPFRRLPPCPRGKIAVLAAVLGVGHYGLLFVAIGGLGAATSSIVMQLCVPFSALIALFLYGERLGVVGWLGMALALLGVVLIEGEPAPLDHFSLVLGLISALCWALANIIVKSIGPVDSLALNGWLALFGAPMLLAMSGLFESHQARLIHQAGLAGWSAVAYTAIMASILSYTVWYRLIARLSLNRVVPFNLLTPVTAVAGGALLLGEPVGWPTLVGGAMTILGVGAIELRPTAARKTKR